MTEKIKSALTQWAKKVLDNKANWDLEETHVAIRKLYEISICQKMLLQDEYPTSDLWKHQQVKTQNVIDSLTRDSQNSKNKSLEENLKVSSLKKTTKKMVTVLPDRENYKNLFEVVVETPTFVLKEKQTSFSSKPIKEINEVKKNITDHFAKTLTIDLNDRLVFIKHLFDGDKVFYERVISQIITFEKWTEVLKFIGNMVKPEYQNWKNKENHEEKFIAILKNSFKD